MFLIYFIFLLRKFYSWVLSSPKKLETKLMVEENYDTLSNMFINDGGIEFNKNLSMENVLKANYKMGKLTLLGKLAWKIKSKNIIG